MLLILVLKFDFDSLFDASPGGVVSGSEARIVAISWSSCLTGFDFSRMSMLSAS